MRIPDKKILDFYRGSGRCEYCSRWCEHRECAHVFAKGMGSNPINIPHNLIALGCVWCCGCHGKSHAGQTPTQEDLLTVVAIREGCTVQAIRDCIREIRRLPKGTPADVWMALLPKRAT